MAPPKPPACAGSCRCRCHALLADRGGRWATGYAWTDAHDRTLARYVEAGYPVTQMTELLNATYKTDRSVWAVKQHVTLLGLSLRTGWYSRKDVARMLGVAEKTVGLWIAGGVLVAQRRLGEAGRWWCIWPTDLEDFVDREAGVRLSARHVRHRRLRARAEVAQARNTRRTG